MELDQRGRAHRRLPAAAHRRAVRRQVCSLWRRAAGASPALCNADSVALQSDEAKRATALQHMDSSTSGHNYRLSWLLEVVPNVMWSCGPITWLQAMIEGLGILLTKMTAPPPAPPPALDGMMGAPQPGGPMCESCLLGRVSAPSLN